MNKKHLGFLFVAGIMISAKSHAQCSCTHMACELCVTAALPGIQSASDGAFEALEQSQEALNEAIDLGKEAESTAIDNYEENVVSALMAGASETTAEIVRASSADARMQEAQKNAYTRLEKADSIARQNLDIGSNYGFNNVSYGNKLLYTAQAGKLVDQGGQPTGELATISTLVSTFMKRSRDYTKLIIKPEEDSRAVTSLDMSIIYQSGLSGGLLDSVVPEVVIPEALSIRRFMVSPSDMQTNMRGVDAKEGDNIGYWRFSSRAKVAAEYLGWDLAIRSEINTEEGKTSLLHFLKESSEQLYISNAAIADDALADERELLDSLATSTAIGNLLDLLLVEVGRNQVNMQAAKIGYMNENAYNPIYGTVSTSITIDSAVRKGNVNGE